MIEEYYTTYILYFTVLTARFLCEFFPDNSAQHAHQAWQYNPLMSGDESVPLLSGKSRQALAHNKAVSKLVSF